MASQHRQIPNLPERPRPRLIPSEVRRSYPVGRQSFSRACQGEVLTLTIGLSRPLPEHIQVTLLTTLNTREGDEPIRLPFVEADEKTLTCRVTPEQAGLHWFRAEYSLDEGATWLPDAVPDAWVLVDPPQVDALRLYTLIPNISGTVADWKADLNRIGAMGFNAVHLLPVTSLDTSKSPYAARDLFDIDPGYLTEASRQDGLSQLEGFIEEARRLNIRLCFDLVLNHIGVGSTMARRAPDWIVPDQNQPDGLRRARYWFNDGWRNWDDLVLINYEHPSEAVRSEIWAYMTNYALFWAKYANDTGGLLRFDNLHSSDADFIQSLTAALHREYPEVGILAEYFTDENTMLRTGLKWGLNLNLATQWNYKFAPQLREYLKYIHRVSEHIRYYMPITSHDSGSPAQEFGSAESTIPRYAASALLGTGATGITQGVEFGEKQRVNFIGRQPKIAYPAEARFAKFIGRVNSILADNPAFRCGESIQFVDDGHPAVIAAFRRDGGAQAFGFLVACNFDTGSAQRIAVDLAPFLGAAGPFPCVELLSGQTNVFPHSQLELLLSPCAAQVLKFSRNG
ncbi:MAG TPA: alpha-amylase family glycosyl hydrolase [Tepidisphaeraceae bacterium]|nr:alpha-amylase family glycosyl hydrolase [Tepidisphaeraceae bacterium]